MKPSKHHTPTTTTHRFSPSVARGFPPESRPAHRSNYPNPSSAPALCPHCSQHTLYNYVYPTHGPVVKCTTTQVHGGGEDRDVGTGTTDNKTQNLGPGNPFSPPLSAKMANYFPRLPDPQVLRLGCVTLPPLPTDPKN